MVVVVVVLLLLLTGVVVVAMEVVVEVLIVVVAVVVVVAAAAVVVVVVVTSHVLKAWQPTWRGMRQPSNATCSSLHAPQIEEHCSTLRQICLIIDSQIKSSVTCGK